MFRRFQALKKGVETIKKVAPKLGTRKSDQIKKSNRMIKDLDKTLKKELGPKLRSEGEKLKKEVEKTRKEIYRSKMALGELAGTSIEDCIDLAYNEIKNRTGKMSNGTYVKNE